MCETGVREFVESLSGQRMSDVGETEWGAVRDGFGKRPSCGKNAPKLVERTCPRCNGPFPIVRRVLESSAYNLPDAAVYQRLRLDSPGIALGLVVPGETTDPEKYPPAPDVRERWQGLMWAVYQVAFVDVRDGVVGEFCPADDWPVGQAPGELAGIVADTKDALNVARAGKQIPVGNSSKETEKALKPILSSVLSKYCYELVESPGWIPHFWYGPGRRPDIVYCRRGEGTLAIEAKVTEDWDHPICEPLGCLLGHNAVINIRMPSGHDKLDCDETRRLVERAEGKLEATGRAKFMCIL